VDHVSGLTGATSASFNIALVCIGPRVSNRAHHFTVDLEEYFQVSAFESCVARSDWTASRRDWSVRWPRCLRAWLDTRRGRRFLCWDGSLNGNRT